jgi:hypothetical protein
MAANASFSVAVYSGVDAIFVNTSAFVVTPFKRLYRTRAEHPAEVYVSVNKTHYSIASEKAFSNSVANIVSGTGELKEKIAEKIDVLIILFRQFVVSSCVPLTYLVELFREQIILSCLTDSGLRVPVEYIQKVLKDSLIV